MKTKKLLVVAVAILSVLFTGCFSLFDKKNEFSIKAIGNKSVDFGNELTFTVEVVNPDEVDITLAADGDLAEHFDPETGVFSWTPTKEDVGTYTLVITATDGKKVVEEEVEITVNNRIVFSTDFTDWEYAASRPEDVIKECFYHSNDDGLTFGVLVNKEKYGEGVISHNHHDPSSWWMSYTYDTDDLIDSITFSYTSKFRDSGNQGRLVLEIYDTSEEHNLLKTIEVPWDNYDGITVTLDNLENVTGIELRYQRTNKLIYDGSELRITDLVINFM